MRLLRLEDGGEFSLVEFIGKNIPRMPCFAHLGVDNEEVAFKDLCGRCRQEQSWL